MPDHQEALKFLSWLRPDGPWVLTAIQPDGPIETRTVQTIEEAAAFIERHDGKRNLYYSPNPSKRPLCAKAKKEDIAAAEFIHVDIDPLPTEKPEAAKARILPLLESFNPRPSGVIDSGNGMQGLWRIAALAEAEAIEPYNRAMIVAFGAGAGTHNCDRILRIPGTMNLPTTAKLRCGRTICQSSITWLEDGRYPIEAFEANSARANYIEQTENAWRETKTEAPPKIDPNNFNVGRAADQRRSNEGYPRRPLRQMEWRSLSRSLLRHARTAQGSAFPTSSSPRYFATKASR